MRFQLINNTRSYNYGQYLQILCKLCISIVRYLFNIYVDSLLVNLYNLMIFDEIIKILEINKIRIQ